MHKSGKVLPKSNPVFPYLSWQPGGIQKPSSELSAQAESEVLALTFQSLQNLASTGRCGICSHRGPKVASAAASPSRPGSSLL